MTQDLIPVNSQEPASAFGSFTIPVLFAGAGETVATRYIEFFTAEIRNINTRAAYGRAVQQFAAWAEEKKFRLEDLMPVHVATYIEHLGQRKEEPLSAPSVKQHLAAIRMLFDYLVRGGACSRNPATAVRGPKHVVKEGKTPVLTVEEAQQLFQSINDRIDKHQEERKAPLIADLRDRALIGVMVFSFGRISAVLNMDVEHYYQQGKRWFIELREKGGKAHKVPVHRKAEEYLDAYIAAAGIAGQKGTPLFRTINERRELTATRLPRQNALAMVKRRARLAGLGERTCNHTFRATGITAYLKNEGTLEHAQHIACHESPRTTKLYDRRHEEVTLDEIEKIRI